VPDRSGFPPSLLWGIYGALSITRPVEGQQSRQADPLTRTKALYLITRFNTVFTTERLLQIIVILSATVVMKWLANGQDASLLTALAGW
jgi:hypothetical protein